MTVLQEGCHLCQISKLGEWHSLVSAKTDPISEIRLGQNYQKASFLGLELILMSHILN